MTPLNKLFLFYLSLLLRLETNGNYIAGKNVNLFDKQQQLSLFDSETEFGVISEKLEDDDGPSWPCPSRDLILPCVCNDDESFNLYMECSAVETEFDLMNAFSNVFPFDDVASLTIAGDYSENSFINLTQGIFDTKSFRSVGISGTMLERIEDNVFVNSHDTLTVLILNDNHISKFPFEIIPQYSILTSLDLNSNQIRSLPQIVSNSLISINMNHNNQMDIPFGKDTFMQVPNLRTIRLADIGLQAIPEDLFAENEHIKNIFLSYNQIIELDIMKINPPSASIELLNLGNNNIGLVRDTSIQGLAADAILDLANNQIELMDETNWRGILNQLSTPGNLIMDGNPLNCGCEFAWIINNVYYWGLFSPLSKCASDKLVSELDPHFFEMNC